MLTSAIRAALLGCLACRPLAAQPMPPRVEVLPLLKETLSSLPVGGVGVGDCFTPVTLGEMKEVALITVSVNGPWERSAEHLAKQVAAETGANCLQPLATYGPEETHFPVVRQYRAYLVTTSVTNIHGTFRFPASPRAFEQSSAFEPLPSAFAAPAPPETAPDDAAAAASPESVLAPSPTRTDPLWIDGSHILAHEIILDTAHMTPQNWEDVRGDVEKYFPAWEYKKLLKTRSRGGTVFLDLRRKTVKPLGDDL